MHIRARIRKGETERIGTKVQVWGSGKWLLVSLYKKRESNGGGGRGGGSAHAAEVDNGNTLVYSGSRTVPPRHGHWGWMETFPSDSQASREVAGIGYPKEEEGEERKEKKRNGKLKIQTWRWKSLSVKAKSLHVMTLTVLMFILDATSPFHENWPLARILEKSIISPSGTSGFFPPATNTYSSDHSNGTATCLNIFIWIFIRKARIRGVGTLSSLNSTLAFAEWDQPFRLGVVVCAVCSVCVCVVPQSWIW